MAHIRTYRTPVKMGNWFEEQRLKEVCLKREREKKKTTGTFNVSTSNGLKIALVVIQCYYICLGSEFDSGLRGSS